MFLPMTSTTPEAWAAEQNVVIAGQWEAMQAGTAARQRDLERREREVEERIRVATEAERSHGIRIRRRDEEEAAEKARAAELAAGRRAIERLKQIDASRRPLDLREVLQSLNFTEHSGGVWRGAAGMAVKLGDAGKWQFRTGKHAAIKAGRGALDLVALILGFFERAILHLCQVFGFERLRLEVEAAAARAGIDRDQRPPSMPDGPSMSSRCQHSLTFPARGSISGRMSKNLDALAYTPRSPAELGAALRALRQARGMTQAQLAMASGISRPTLISVEAGKGRADTLLRLVRMLGGTLTLSLPARVPDLAEGEMEMGIDL